MDNQDKTIEFYAGVGSEDYKLEMKWRTFLVLFFMLVLAADLAAIAYLIQAIRWW